MHHPGSRLALLTLLLSLPALAQPYGQYPSRQRGAALRDDGPDDEWERTAHFFIGARGGVAIPPGGRGVSPTMGIELGVVAPKGIGFGLHLLGSTNTPAVPALKIPTATFGLGAAVDIRFYFQTVEPLTLYPTLSLGFMAGPGTADGTNVVLPMINPGFGARVKTGSFYTSFEFGLASFTIPFVNLSLGYEMERPPPAHRPLAAAPCPSPAPVFQGPPPAAQPHPQPPLDPATQTE